MFAGRTTRGLLTAMDGVAKHLCHDLRTAKKVHLKSVRLFFRTWFGVDAFDI